MSSPYEDPSARAGARLAAIVESSQDAIISKNLQGVIETWNAAAERIYGYSAPEIIGSPMTLLLPADRAGEEADILAQICYRSRSICVARRPFSSLMTKRLLER